MNIPHMKDKYYITYGIFYLLGILTYIPNHFVITASRYWMFKFRFLGPRPPGKEIDGQTMGLPTERNRLQASFLSSYHTVSQLSLIIFIVITAAYSRKMPPPEKRISAALLCTLVFYVVNLIFCTIRTDTFQLAFFFTIMFIVCCLGVCRAVIIVSLFEMVNTFPSEYYTAILTGQSLCGVISAIILIITISVTKSPITGGIIFFGIGTSLVFITSLVYWYCKRNSQYFIYQVGNDPTREIIRDNRSFFPRIWSQIKSASKHTKLYTASLIIVSGTTAMVYPGLMSLVVARKNNGHGQPWDEMYFSAVVTFLVATLCDLGGRILATMIKKPCRGSIILIMAICRIGFIPIMMFCNVQPRMNVPVLFFDTLYIVFTILFSFSNGYLVNLCVTIVPTRAQNGEEKLITVMTVLSGVFSTAVCSFLSLLLVHVL